MAVIINSSVPSSASHESSLTSVPLTLNVAGEVSAGGTSTIPISSIIGLQTALDTKLSDVAGAVGVGVVTTTGVDLNLLSGLSAYGLVAGDLQKLADLTVSSTELNYLTGLTGNIQTQIDDIPSNSDYTAADQIAVSTGVGVTTIATLADVLSGTTGIGYEFSNLKPATASADFNAQSIINVADPVNAQDAATKNYVDTSVSAGYLALAGGTMTGSLDMDGNTIVLDADADTSLSASVDDTVVMSVNGTSYTWGTASFDVGGSTLSNVADPVNAQDAVTRNFATNTYLALGGGVMTGSLDLNGNDLLLDADGDTQLKLGTDNVVTLQVNGVERYAFDNNGLNLAVDGTPRVISGVADPVAATDVATKNYTDTNFLMLSGGTMTGPIDLGGFALSNPLAPTGGTGIGDRDYNDARYLLETNNLSDLVDASAARTNLGLATVAATGDYADLINTPTLTTTLTSLTDVNTGTPGAVEDGYVLAWNNTASEYVLTDPSVDSVFGRTGTVVATAGDYTAALVTNVPSGSLTGTTVQAAIDELETNKLDAGSATMTGTLDMNNNQLTNLALPFVAGVHNFTTGAYQSTNGGNSYYMNTSGSATAAAPTYSFDDGTDTGMWSNGGTISLSVDGTDRFVVSNTDVSAENNQIKNVADPSDDQDAVTLAYLNAQMNERVLGSTTGIDMVGDPAGTNTTVYTVPVGKQHIITKVIIVPTSYVPGISPVDGFISLGLLAGSQNEIVSNTVATWGPAGASDQAIYMYADQGAATPNASAGVVLQLVTPASGTFTSLTVNVYVMGFEV